MLHLIISLTNRETHNKEKGVQSIHTHTHTHYLIDNQTCHIIWNYYSKLLHQLQLQSFLDDEQNSYSVLCTVEGNVHSYPLWQEIEKLLAKLKIILIKIENVPI